MKILDCYEVYEQVEGCAKNGGIIYRVLNDNYTPSSLIYDYILLDRNTKKVKIYVYVKRSGREYKERNYERMPTSWENKISPYADCWVDMGYAVGGELDYKELYGDLCE